MAENDATAPITKVSDLTPEYLADYLHIDVASDAQTKELATMLNSAKSYLSSYTGLPITAPTDDPDTTADESAVTTLDSKPEFVTAVCVLVQNNYDNRTFYVDRGEVEKVVDSIMGLHGVNLL